MKLVEELLYSYTSYSFANVLLATATICKTSDRRKFRGAPRVPKRRGGTLLDVGVCNCSEVRLTIGESRKDDSRKHGICSNVPGGDANMHD